MEISNISVEDIEMFIDNKWPPFSYKEAYTHYIEHKEFPQGRTYNGKDFLPFNIGNYFSNLCFSLGINVLKQQWQEEV